MNLTSNKIKSFKWKILVVIIYAIAYAVLMGSINTWWFHTNSATQTGVVVFIGYYLIRITIYFNRYIDRRYHD